MTERLRLESGHEVEKLEEKDLEKRFFLYNDGVVKLHPGEWIYMAPFIRYANLIFNFEVSSTLNSL